jgi:amidohydrolase
MSTTTDTLRSDIDEIMPGVIADRRYLHTIPELGKELHDTAAYVLERLKAIGPEDIRTGIAVTGITALIKGTRPGPERVVLLRADMDALPIIEENDVEYVSTRPGAMHACGHDAHTSMLLGIAQLLMERRDQFSGTVKLLFQPCEELPPGGAKFMIEEGVLENPHVDAVFGMHVSQDTPAGQIKFRPGPSSANSDRVQIVVQGKGGHGAAPHDTVDPVITAAHIAIALQTIVSRNVDPIDSAVITIGKLAGGEANNVIPDTAEMKLTVRTFTPEVRALVKERLSTITNNVAAAFGATATINYVEGYPSVINDPACTALVEEEAVKVVGRENAILQGAKMGGEDFSYFLNERPGSFFYVGTRNEDRGLVWGHHHPRFDIDEEGLKYGIETMTRVAMRYLNEGV